MNLRYKLMRFLSGRYGVDKSFYVLFSVAAALALLNCFLRSLYIQAAVYALCIYALFRMLSKNIAARQRENTVITGWVYKLKRKYAAVKRQKADKAHIYRRCPRCRAVLRLPKKKGKHKTVCPKCGEEFSVRVRSEK